MGSHSTHYTETFITAAADCPASEGRAPAARGDAWSAPQWQYELLRAAPYTYTSDALLFEVHVRRLGLDAAEVQARRAELWDALFSKPQACLRSSALAKTHGWGFHFDAQGRVALVSAGSAEYERLSSGEGVRVLAAMRNKRA